MKPRPSFSIGIWLMVGAVLLTVFTGVAGAAPLRLLRRFYGRFVLVLTVFGGALVFWGLGLAPLSLFFFLLGLAVVIQMELEGRVMDPMVSAFIATGTVSVVAAGVFFGWVTRQGENWFGRLSGQIEGLLAKYFAEPMQVKEVMSATDILFQAPSIFVVVVGLSLFIGIVLERPFLRAMRLNLAPTVDLRQFRLPGMMIWLLIASLAGAFVQHGIRPVELVALNFLNVMVLLYFFQGLSVLVYFSDQLRMTPFFRTFILFILVFYLFVLVSGVGVIDYWYDFRGRHLRKSAEFKRTV